MMFFAVMISFASALIIGLASGHYYAKKEGLREGREQGIREITMKLNIATSNNGQEYIRGSASVVCQRDIATIVKEAFGLQSFRDPIERGARFIEESFELLQTVEYPKEHIVEILEYVYSREKGEFEDELGDVGMTLVAFAASKNAPFSHLTAETVKSFEKNMEKIVHKNATKPRYVPPSPEEE